MAGPHSISRDRSASSALTGGLLMLWMGMLLSVEGGLFLAKKGHLQIFVVPHSHLDPGWKYTFEEYYLNKVRPIFRSVLNALCQDTARRFILSEASLLSRWYDEEKDHSARCSLHPHVSTWSGVVHAVLATKQLEFVGGGWVQQDEAVTTLPSIIEQLTQGHRYLRKEFNVTPEHAYQIDSFGYSSLSPTLFSNAGFKTLVINRIPYYQKLDMSLREMAEFYWKGFDEGPELFTHILYPHYSDAYLKGPDGTDWEKHSLDILQANVAKRADMFVARMRERAQEVRHDNILYLWGDDFRFVSADTNFGNMDKLISHINNNTQRYNVNVRYATLAEYMEAAKRAVDATGTHPRYTGDFFPYSDIFAHNYWTGYFSLRPSIKQYIREAEALVRSADVAIAAAFLVTPQSERGAIQRLLSDMEQAKRAYTVVLHHDAITATCKEHVYQDYMQLLMRSVTISSNVLKSALPYLLHRREQEYTNMTLVQHLPPFYYFDSAWTTHAPLLMPAAKQRKSLSTPLIFFNSLEWERIECVDLILPAAGLGNILDMNGKPQRVQVTNMSLLIDGFIDNPSATPEKLKDLVRASFFVTVPPLGFSTYYVQAPRPALQRKVTEAIPKRWNGREDVRLGNGAIDAVFHRKTGRLYSLALNDEEHGRAEMKVKQHFRFYRSESIKVLGSGAYVFRATMWHEFWLGAGGGYLFGCCIGLILLFVYSRVRGRPVGFTLFYGIAGNLGNHRRARYFLLFVESFLLAYLCFHYLAQSNFEEEEMRDIDGLQVIVIIGIVVVLIHGMLGCLFISVGFSALFLSLYAFLPATIAQPITTHKPTVYIISGEILDEVVQVFSPTKIRQRARIYKPQERDAKAQHAFLELVQRVSVEPNIELVSRFDVGTMLSDLFTDNGLHLMRSSYKPHRLIPGNYYPMVSQAVVKGSDGLELILISKQGHGVALLNDQLEVMLHRRPMQDDQKGLGSAVDDGSTVDVAFRLHLSYPSQSRYRSHSITLREPASIVRLGHPLRLYTSSPVSSWRAESAFSAIPPDPGAPAPYSLGWHLLSWEVFRDIGGGDTDTPVCMMRLQPLSGRAYSHEASEVLDKIRSNLCRPRQLAERTVTGLGNATKPQMLLTLISTT